ncbi:MAG: MarR family transcriptional regulator [Clostridia bacterium]|nr:MarR family transcriptional regulator [Clostridia bacterium]
MTEAEQMEEALKLNNQLCFPLYAAARQIVASYTPYLKPLGLTYTQYIVFLVLWEKREISVRDLCHMLHLDSGTLTPVLKKLETEGYLVRSRHAADERVVILNLTEKGSALKDACRMIPLQVGQCVQLTPEEALFLHRVLYKILDAESGNDSE